MTPQREELNNLVAKVVHHAKAVTDPLAEVTVPRALFAAITGRVGRLRPPPRPGRAFALGGWE